MKDSKKTSNDLYEYKFAEENIEIDESVFKAIAENSDDKEKNYTLNKIKFLLKPYNYSKEYFYSFSLSKEEKLNNLLMWRLYGQNCNGVAIGFEFNFTEIGYIDDAAYAFGKICYEIPQHLKEFVKEFNIYFKEASEYKQLWFPQIYLLYPFIKSPDFKHENEVRLILHNKERSPYQDKSNPYHKCKNIYFDVNKNNEPVTYCKIPVDEKGDNPYVKVTIKHIVLGGNLKNRYKELSKKIETSCKLNLNYPIEINVSELVDRII